MILSRENEITPRTRISEETPSTESRFSLIPSSRTRDEDVFRFKLSSSYIDTIRHRSILSPVATLRGDGALLVSPSRRQFPAVSTAFSSASMRHEKPLVIHLHEVADGIARAPYQTNSRMPARGTSMPRHRWLRSCIRVYICT